MDKARKTGFTLSLVKLFKKFIEMRGTGAWASVEDLVGKLEDGELDNKVEGEETLD